MFINMPKLTRDIIEKAAEKVRIDPYSQPFQPKDLGLNASDYGSFSDYCSKEETKSGYWNPDVVLKVAEKTKSGRPLRYLLKN